ncbi:polyisoprenoid-binding protein [Opitutaceae bacterium EW11]|nr:polyisoprenoid-binding protein [Opitutaceae bacterium EW11]
MKRILAAVSLFAIAAVASRAAVETYKIDPVHSSVTFTATHIISKVPGQFTRFEGSIAVDRDNLEASSAQAVIEVGSIDTRNEKRDTHLKSPDFFDAAKHPTMTFKSTSWKKTGENTFDVTGDLTIKGVTKPVVLKTKLLGFAPGINNTPISAWEASTSIKRQDFGMQLKPMLDKVVGENIDISITVESDLQK